MKMKIETRGYEILMTHPREGKVEGRVRLMRKRQNL